MPSEQELKYGWLVDQVAPRANPYKDLSPESQAQLKGSLHEVILMMEQRTGGRWRLMNSLDFALWQSSPDASREENEARLRLRNPFTESGIDKKNTTVAIRRISEDSFGLLQSGFKDLAELDRYRYQAKRIRSVVPGRSSKSPSGYSARP